MVSRFAPRGSRSVAILSVAFCLLIVAWTAAVPLSDASRLRQTAPNEGWNVFHAQQVAEHRPLYPAGENWTPVNYPALSFHVIAALHILSGDYLFTGRVLSLVSLCICGVLAALIVYQLGRSRLAAWLCGLFLVAIFCANARIYVGMDDPHVFAQVFYLAGIYAYIKGNRRGWALDLVVLLFVIGGNIKHSPIEFPIAVFLDLLFSSPRRALRFAGVGVLLVALSVALTSWIDGPAYLSCLLSPRAYSAANVLPLAWSWLKPILLPVVAGLWMAFHCFRNPSQRVLAILLIVALALNTCFAGGYGVGVNTIFGSMLAIVLLNGVFWAEFPTLARGPLSVLPRAVLCAVFFLWLAVPMRSRGGGWGWTSLERKMNGSRADELRFATEVAFLRRQPGDAICDMSLSCFYAGKPFIYDFFNTPRLMALGKLDPNVLVNRLRNHQYGAIEIVPALEEKFTNCSNSAQCVPSIDTAIRQYYRPAFEDEDTVIYLPAAPNSGPQAVNPATR